MDPTARCISTPETAVSMSDINADVATIKALREQLNATLTAAPPKSQICEGEGVLESIAQIAEKYGVRAVGFADVEPLACRDAKTRVEPGGVTEWLINKAGIHFPHCIVMSMEMNKEDIDKAPGPEAQAEVTRVYYKLGRACMEVAESLRSQGYYATVGHPLGGDTLYTVLAERAHMGTPGRQGLIMAPGVGPRHRLGVVYTSITDLPTPQRTNSPAPEYFPIFQQVCAKCTRCSVNCPAGAILDQTVTSPNGNVTRIDPVKCRAYFSTHDSCGVCLRECSLVGVSIEDLKSRRL
ncbi:epoxyqueuosine reductase [Pelomyxa schiedti]|nr:epoxyqueuosine reductase [Pelomyxa schiedti]